MLTNRSSYYNVPAWSIKVNQKSIGPFEFGSMQRMFKVTRKGIYLYLPVTNEILSWIDEGDRFTASYYHLKITMTIKRIKILSKLKLESDLPPTMVIKLIGKPVIQWL